MSTLSTFATRFKELRESAGMKQSEISEKLGVSRGAISFYENCDRTPDIEFAAKAAKFFNVSADYLLGLTGERAVDANVRQICNYTGLKEGAVEYLHSLSVHTEQAMLIFINDLLLAPILINKLLDYYASAFHRLSLEEPYSTLSWKLPHFKTLLDERIHMGVIFDSLPQDRQHFFNRYKDDKYVSEQMLFELIGKEDSESLGESKIISELFEYMYRYTPPTDNTTRHYLTVAARFLASNPKNAHIAQGKGVDLQRFIDMDKEDVENGKHQKRD